MHLKSYIVFYLTYLNYGDALKFIRLKFLRMSLKEYILNIFLDIRYKISLVVKVIELKE